MINFDEILFQSSLNRGSQLQQIYTKCNPIYQADNYLINLNKSMTKFDY